MNRLGTVRLLPQFAPVVQRPLPVARASSGPSRRLGAEELIELGQAATRPQETRTVTLSAEEGRLVIKVVENLVSFARDYPIEFHSYCPTDRWQKALTDVGTWIHEVERQLNAGARTVTMPTHVIFEMVDLEKCVSAARDARLGAARTAFTLSAIGAIADVVFGITWLGIPAYIAGLALLLGRPLVAKFGATPQEPYKSELAGRFCLGGDCQLIAMKLKKDAEKDSMKRQVLERVIVSPIPEVERHHWGTVRPNVGPEEGAVFLKKDRFRVRVEGWKGDVVVPQGDWELTDEEDCVGGINIGVYTPQTKRTTTYGPLNMDSGHDESYWVEYAGPLTEGLIRRAGPFGCTGDPVDHAMEDAGFTEPGKDGGYVIFDSSGQVVSEGTG